MLTSSIRQRESTSASRSRPAFTCAPAKTSDRPAPVGPVKVGQGLLSMPFDALRIQYASAVMTGLARRSLIASGKRERALDTLEKLMLGPLARRR